MNLKAFCLNIKTIGKMAKTSKLSSKNELIKLSRTVSHALRHAPDEYGIKLDNAGWVDTASLLKALESKNTLWKGLSEIDLHSMAAAGDKQRYEISDSRIRAIYGHSVPSPIEYDETVPPDLLYHGTTKNNAAKILKGGLKTMKRQYVHLSADVETATQVALRRTPDPVLLKVNAAGAHKAGAKFYKGNDNVWLTKDIDKIFIE